MITKNMAINNIHITWYMQEIAMHHLGANTEFLKFQETLRNERNRQKRIVWFHLTSFLSHGAMISKYLSPIARSPSAIALERKQRLRELLGVDANSEVLPRTTRDNVEHFDERVDNWVEEDAKSILEIVFENRKAYDFLMADEKRVKRVLLLDEMVFISERPDRSKFELSLLPLHQEISRIGNEAERWLLDDSPVNFVFPRR